jgi:hypothetical protein
MYSFSSDCSDLFTTLFYFGDDIDGSLCAERITLNPFHIGLCNENVLYVAKARFGLKNGFLSPNLL